MIQGKNLRENNYIAELDGTLTIVNRIEKLENGTYSINGRPEDNFQAVLLTSDILSNGLGFDKYENERLFGLLSETYYVKKITGMNGNSLKIVVVFDKADRQYKLVTQNDIAQYGCSFELIKLHELQNIYLNETGKMLYIKGLEINEK